VRAIDLAHSPRAQEGEEAIGPEFPTQQRSASAGRGRDAAKDRFLQEAACPIVLRNEHLDLTPQLDGIAAGFGEKRSATFRRSLQRSVEEILGSPPEFLLRRQLSVLRRFQFATNVGISDAVTISFYAAYHWSKITRAICLNQAALFLLNARRLNSRRGLRSSCLPRSLRAGGRSALQPALICRRRASPPVLENPPRWSRVRFALNPWLV
jgi:hypothetical protein